MAQNLNDLEKVVVKPPNLTDSEYSYFSNADTARLQTLNGATLKTLIGAGATSNNLNTAWSQVLTLLGYVTGTMQDKQKAFWAAGGFPP